MQLMIKRHWEEIFAEKPEHFWRSCQFKKTKKTAQVCRRKFLICTWLNFVYIQHRLQWNHAFLKNRFCIEENSLGHRIIESIFTWLKLIIPKDLFFFIYILHYNRIIATYYEPVEMYLSPYMRWVWVGGVFFF